MITGEKCWRCGTFGCESANNGDSRCLRCGALASDRDPSVTRANAILQAANCVVFEIRDIADEMGEYVDKMNKLLAEIKGTVKKSKVKR